MSESQASKLRKRIADMEREMMEFRSSMAVVLTELYKTVHELERQQRWSYKPDDVERLKILRDCIVNHFDDGELRNMCFSLGVNYDSLLDGGIDDKARELVLYMNRLGRCSELIDYCRTHRPNAKLMIE